MRQQVGVLLLLAVGVTLLNAVKPLHMDAAAYAAYAAHIAREPLAPYAFDIYWYSGKYHPANQLLAPPVVLYWLAGAMHLFGDEPTLWKLTLLPFHVLLVAALYALFRRFAAAWTLALVTLTVLSPALLPAPNLMLDVPALALSLAAIAVFLRAVDRASWQATVAAGLLAGLAVQTKYTALVTPALFLACALTHGCWRQALTGTAVALLMFAGWEIFVAWRHGDSHFLLALAKRDGSPLSQFRHLALPLLTMTAGVAPGTLLLALGAVTRSGRWLALTIGLLFVGVLLIGLVPASITVFLANRAGQPQLGLENVLFAALAIAFWTGLACVVRQLVRQGRRLPQEPDETTTKRRWHRDTVLLLLWLGLEIAVYFALSPFPAARRVLGIVVVATLLSGRWAATVRAGQRRPIVVATLVGAVAGIFVAAIDLQEALATRRAAEKTAALVNLERHGRTAWFHGGWGLLFYSLRDGLKPVVIGRQVLAAGDLLVLEEYPAHGLDFCPDQAPLLKLTVICQEDALPWRTVLCYYSGRTPLQHQEGPRLRLTIYRVQADFVPRSSGTSIAWP